MQDTVEITLPESNKKVVIRNYTTRADDALAESMLFMDVEVATTDYPLSNVLAHQAVYVQQLVESIDGNKENIKDELNKLRSKDYHAIDKAVEKIIEANSPKVSEAEKASANITIKK